jgi:hypothetical protein
MDRRAQVSTGRVQNVHVDLELTANTDTPMRPEPAVRLPQVGIFDLVIGVFKQPHRYGPYNF